MLKGAGQSDDLGCNTSAYDDAPLQTPAILMKRKGLSLNAGSNGGAKRFLLCILSNSLTWQHSSPSAPSPLKRKTNPLPITTITRYCWRQAAVVELAAAQEEERVADQALVEALEAAPELGAARALAAQAALREQAELLALQARAEAPALLESREPVE